MNFVLRTTQWYTSCMKIRLTTSQNQKQTLAPALQQSISILMLSITELNTSIEQELQSNPMLELDTTAEGKQKSKTIKDIIHSYSNESGTSPQSQQTYEDEEIPQTPIIQNKSLEDHLLTQLRIEISDPIKQKIGEMIIGNLDADGYLSTPLEEIAWLAKTSDIHVVESTLQIIQQFDPAGIASRDIKECLINQIRASQSKHRLQAIQILEKHFEHFFAKKFELIAKATKIKTETICEIAQFIATLEPKPIRNFQGGEPTIYVQPDVFVFKDSDDNFQIEINKRETPSMRINPLYMKMLENPNTSEIDRKFIQEKLTNAINFIKSIQLRGETLRQISRLIVDRQRLFFEGKTSTLSPLALKDLAQALDRNESTISRAVNNKYMQTPLGIFPLRFFFSNAVNEDNKDVSSHNIKIEIRNLVNAEDKKNPLTDQEILAHFTNQGVKMARRTINKYRQELNIPPSHQRKI